MKTQKIKKLFYGKWKYKVTVEVPDITKLRRYDTDTIKTGSKFPDLKEFVLFLDEQSCEYAKRIEGKFVDVYTNDRNFYDSTIAKYQNQIKHCFEPDENSENLFTGKRTVVARKLPHDRFQYKVYLQPHNIKNKEDKRKFLDFLDNQGQKIKITETVKNWFIRTDWNWDRRYIYVQDEPTLLMLKMRSSEGIGSVYTYVICDK
jgi:hypothetical protein